MQLAAAAKSVVCTVNISVVGVVATLYAGYTFSPIAVDSKCITVFPPPLDTQNWVAVGVVETVVSVYPLISTDPETAVIPVKVISAFASTVYGSPK